MKKNTSFSISDTASTKSDLENNSLFLESQIIEVWDDNYNYELDQLSKCLDQFNIASIDTEFPGVIWKAKSMINREELEYSVIRENANVLKIIQLGISLSDENGNRPEYYGTWQFNFHFDLENDSYEQNSINLLQAGGINFELMKKKGIKQEKFFEKFKKIIIQHPKIKWIVYHGGYDFGYLIKYLKNKNLPQHSQQFTLSLSSYFKTIFDLKLLEYKQFNNSYGLKNLAKFLQIERAGQQHQAGSDSKLTLDTYLKLIKQKENLQKQNENLKNIIFGIGKGYYPHQNYQKNLVSVDLNAQILSQTFQNTPQNYSISFFNQNYYNYIVPLWNQSIWLCYPNQQVFNFQSY